MISWILALVYISTDLADVTTRYCPVKDEFMGVAKHYTMQWSLLGVGMAVWWMVLFKPIPTEPKVGLASIWLLVAWLYNNTRM